MTSQGPGLEILERLTEWSSEEIENNLDHILTELLSHLTGEDKGHVLQAVYALLVTCLPSMPIERADQRLLSHAMPAAQQLFHESLEGIKLRLDDKSQSEFTEIADTLSSLLQVCIEILKCMECVLQYIMNQTTVNISTIPSVPKTIAFLMLQTFKHCQESETLYRDLFSTVADVLGAAFRQCHQVQCQFFAVVSSNITFDCTVETDVVHLVEVLQVLSEVGEQVMSLDIKTMAEQWKGYAKIVQLYLEPIRERLNIAYPISYLCLEVNNNLNLLTDQESNRDAKSTSRLLKTTSFILKILVKFCEQFGTGHGCLGDCHSTLYQLLITLHRFSPPLLKIRNIERTLVEEIERHVTVAADPLLSHLICEVDFREEFFRKSCKVSGLSDDCLPHLALMLLVMKKIAAFTAENKDCWLGDSKKTHIVGCLLEILKKAHFELSCEIWLAAILKPGDAPRSCDFYEALCCHTAGLVLSFNVDQFQRVESILLDTLLEPFVWPALLSGDVWCICARAGSSDLVLDQILYFADIVSSFEPASLTGRVECKVLTLFLRRMCSFLGAKGKQILFEKFPPSSYPLHWQIFGLKCLSKEMRDLAAQALITTAITDVQKFSSVNTSVLSFNKMVLSLFGLSAALEVTASNKSSYDQQLSGIVPEIISLWQFACKGDLAEHLGCSDIFLAGPKWLMKLLCILCKCTEHLVHIMNNKEILQVLDQLDGAIKHCNPSLKLSVIQILHGLATKVLEVTSDQGLASSKISNLFACLLEDQNPFVQEAALETFEYFAHFTVHEGIVADAVADSKAIQEVVTSYLQKETPVIDSQVKTLDRREYLKFQANISCDHMCASKKPRPASPKSLEKPAKKIRLDCDDSDLSAFLADDLLTEFVGKDITDAVSRIVKDSQYLISQSSFGALPLTSKTDLRKTIEDLEKFIKN